MRRISQKPFAAAFADREAANVERRKRASSQSVEEQPVPQRSGQSPDPGRDGLHFGTLILLGYWNRLLGILGALGSIVTFLGTVTIIPFLPNAWATEAGGFPAMYLPVAFLMKDFLFLAASFYLLKQDVVRAAAEIEHR
jgi:hypothetical protein